MNINLLRKSQPISPAFLNIATISQRIAIGFLSVFILVTVAVFAIRLFFTVETGRIEDRIKAASQQIQSQKSTEGVYLSYSKKLSAIDTITKDRFTPADTIKKIKRVLPSVMTISMLSLDRENFILTVEFPYLETLEGAISGLQDQTEVPIKEFTLQSLDKNPKTGKYLSSFQIVIGP